MGAADNVESAARNASATQNAKGTRGPQRLLLVDDNAQLLKAMVRSLERSGYETTTAKDGAAALEAFEAHKPDLIVLDVMMPGMDGWEVCQRLRDISRVPIIMLTARANENDRITGLKMGADDYIGKPFSLKELEARIEAVLRRARMVPLRSSSVVYDDGRLHLDAASMQVTLEGESINLTATERRLLFALAERAGWVLPPDQILREVWGPEYEGQSDYVKLYVWRLRQKLEGDPTQPTYIRTERGLGYRFVPLDGADGADAAGATAENGPGA